MRSTRSQTPWVFLFFALLWVCATFVYLGATGKHSDDYWATMRFVDHDGIDWSSHPWRSWPYFWRPLHIVHIWIVNTLLWNHDWAAHLELALAHAGVCWAFYGMLVRLGARRGPAIAAALLFGTCPLVGESVLWSSASCNAIGSLLMLVCLHLGVRFARAGTTPDDGSIQSARPRNPLRPLLAIAAMSFATACFYEPAAAGLAAMPVVVWCSSARESRVCRTLLATAAAGLPCMLYAALLLGTAPPGARGSVDGLAFGARATAALLEFFHDVRRWTVGARGRSIVLGSIEQGLWAAREHRFVLGTLVAMILAGLLALPRILRAIESPADRAPDRLARGPAVLNLAAVLLVFPWTPFLISSTRGIEMRSLYVPLLGAACLVAVVGTAIGRRIPTHGIGRVVWRLTATAAVGLATLGGTLGLIGMQTQFRTNAQLDAQVARQLAALSPLVEPKTGFVVLTAKHRGSATHHPEYNAAIHTALEAPWSATTFLWRAMHRRDVGLISMTYWARDDLPVFDLSETEMHAMSPQGKVRSVPWSRVVALWIDESAAVHIVQSLDVEPIGGPPARVALPRAQQLVQAALAAGVPVEAGDRFRLTEIPGHRAHVTREAAERP